MFSTLESTWDQSARRGWTTLASFTMQAFGLSLLLAISIALGSSGRRRCTGCKLAGARSLRTARRPHKLAMHQHHAAATVSNLFRGQIDCAANRSRLTSRQTTMRSQLHPAPNLPDIDVAIGSRTTRWRCPMASETTFRL